MTDPTGVRISVPADLGSSGPIIAGIASDIGNELAQLASLLQPLHEYWQGQANENWIDMQMRWDSAAIGLMAPAGALGAMGRTATVNWNNYVECEAANVRTWAH